MTDPTALFTGDTIATLTPSPVPLVARPCADTSHAAWRVVYGHATVHDADGVVHHRLVMVNDGALRVAAPGRWRVDHAPVTVEGLGDAELYVNVCMSGPDGNPVDVRLLDT